MGQWLGFVVLLQPRVVQAAAHTTSFLRHIPHSAVSLPTIWKALFILHPMGHVHTGAGSRSAEGMHQGKPNSSLLTSQGTLRHTLPAMGPWCCRRDPALPDVSSWLEEAEPEDTGSLLPKQSPTLYRKGMPQHPSCSHLHSQQSTPAPCLLLAGHINQGLTQQLLLGLLWCQHAALRAQLCCEGHETHQHLMPCSADPGSNSCTLPLTGDSWLSRIWEALPFKQHRNKTAWRSLVSAPAKAVLNSYPCMVHTHGDTCTCQREQYVQQRQHQKLIITHSHSQSPNTSSRADKTCS